MSIKKGNIVQVLGCVVDVAFPEGNIPSIKHSLSVEVNGEHRIMEVARHVGDNTVRCFMLSSSEGLYRGLEVISEGKPIHVPVGKEVLGRIFNVLGDTIDGKGRLKLKSGGVYTEDHRNLPISDL